jgi:hypothetical protein
MKTRKIATSIQKKLTHTLTKQLQRSSTIADRSRNGECWPQNGQAKTIMWQSTGWPVSGKRVPHTAQSFFSHFK